MFVRLLANRNLMNLGRRAEAQLLQFLIHLRLRRDGRLSLDDRGRLVWVEVLANDRFLCRQHFDLGLAMVQVVPSQDDNDGHQQGNDHCQKNVVLLHFFPSFLLLSNTKQKIGGMPIYFLPSILNYF